MKTVFKVLIIIFYLISCNLNEVKNNKNEISEVSIENKALIFFTDSLLYKKVFNRNVENRSKETAVYLSPVLDQSLYKNGLFKSKVIYTGGITYSLSKPYQDTTNFSEIKEYFSDYDTHELAELYSDYWKRVGTVDTISLSVKEPLAYSSFDEFIKKELYKESLFLKPHNYLKTDDEFYVQLEVLDIDFPGAFQAYNFYIVFDTEKNVNRWVLY